MKEQLLNFVDLVINDYGVIILIIAIVLLVWGIYNKIRFLCLEKASEMVARAEEHSELSGEEKFALCVLWIHEELPRVFRNSLVISIVEKLLEFVYKNSFEYMKKYVKRKTGYDITELIDKVKETVEDVKENNEEKENKEENK